MKKIVLFIMIFSLGILFFNKNVISSDKTKTPPSSSPSGQPVTPTAPPTVLHTESGTWVVTPYSDGTVDLAYITENSTTHFTYAGGQLVDIDQVQQETGTGDDIISDLTASGHIEDIMELFNEQGIAGNPHWDSIGYGIDENGWPLTPMDYSTAFQFQGHPGDDPFLSYYTNTNPLGQTIWFASLIVPNDPNNPDAGGTIYYFVWNPIKGEWIQLGYEQWAMGSGYPGGNKCGGACYCCDSHEEVVTHPDGSTSTKTICDRWCKNYTCHWKECSGCCCVSRSATYTVDCDDPCPCPSSECSSNCDCCGRPVCYPKVYLSIDPDRLFVNQTFYLQYSASGNSCCGNLTCNFSCQYLGHNCGIANELKVCPEDAQGKDVCSQRLLPRLSGRTSYSGTIPIVADKEFWGTYKYTLKCWNSCGQSRSYEASVFVVPVLYYQEAQPFSLILKPFISLIEGLNK